MVKTPLLHLTCVLLAAGLAVLPAPAETHASAWSTSVFDFLANSEDYEEARNLIAAGKFDEAEEAAMKILSKDPYDTNGYLVMFDIAAARPEPDVPAMLRWGKWLTWSYSAAGNKAGLAVISERMNEVYEGWEGDTLILNDWRKLIEKGVKSASSKKQYRVAGHLIDKLLDLNPQDPSLAKMYEKLIDKAGNEISGGAFVSSKVKSKSARWLAKNNAKHSNWEDRWEMKTKNYTIETTMDYEFFQTLAAVMDEMNTFYRKVYDYKKKTPRVRLLVHRRRSDFDRTTVELTGNPIQSESVGGFWLVGAKTVNAFDRSNGDPNQTRADLWNTLFHEASHQFMSIIMDKSEKRNYSIPAWLNEGAASYFEGCVIKADGTILKNNVAEHRLRSWWSLEQSNMRKSLEELVAHPRNAGPDMVNRTRSYEGEFYPYGWAFVYFLLNYEEGDRRVYGPSITPGKEIPAEYKEVRAAGKLVYRQAYLDYIAHFAKEGNKNNDQYYPLEMAKKFFIEEIGDPDVPNWEAFEDRWRRFTNALYGEMLAGPEFADVLQARSRGYLMVDDFERARTTAEQADLKRPNDAETYRLLALANLGEGLEGDAMFWMLRHWEVVWPAGDELATDDAEQWIAENGGKELVKNYIEPTKIALAATRGAMEKALGDGHPIMATLYASHAMQAFQLRFDDLTEQAEEMAEIAGQDLRFWQEAYNLGPEANRRATDDDGNLVDVVLYEKDGVLIYNPKGWASPGLEHTTVANLQTLKPPYSMRGTIQLDGPDAIITLGIDRSGRAQLYVVFDQWDEVEDALLLQTVSFAANSRVGSATLRPTLVGGFRWDRVDKINFEMTVEKDGKGTFRVNDMEPIPLPDEFKVGRLTGGFAITTADETAALFSNVAVRPNTAFWPVAPRVEDDKK